MPHIDTSAHHDARPQQQHPHHSHHQPRYQPYPADSGSSSPVAPAYSPITPKVQPAIPVANAQPAFVPPDNATNFTFSVANPSAHPPPLPHKDPVPIAPPAQYISQPPNRPFSSEDATDAIALRAAISTLQFQKKKAQDDIKVLENIKQLALDDPNQFKAKLASGGLIEQRPKLGDIKAVLDHDDDDNTDDERDEDSVKLGAMRESGSRSPEIPDSQPTSYNTSFAADATAMDIDAPKEFPPIPGPQSVVRMPYVNWDKYGVVGGPLESMHAQQQRWPGSTAYGQDRGREHTVAAPYSPWLDNLEGQQHTTETDDRRKDSAAMSTSTSTPAPFISATGTISEHPMETRSRH